LIVTPGPVGDLIVANRLPLEEYVEGVVASEIALWSALPAELEAQAIVSRTYAVRRMQLNGELLDSTLDQAFKGRPMLADSPAARRVAERLRAAVEATCGAVLTLDGALLDARYHAACGGIRAEHAVVFPDGGRGTPQVSCDPCYARAQREIAAGGPAAERPLIWRWSASREELLALARDLQIGTRVLRLEPTQLDAGGRWIEVEIVGNRLGKKLSMVELRSRLGADRLKSARILRTWPPPGEPIPGGLFFEGLGRGHGVGLCQEGSHDFAGEGWSAAAILAHAYPGTSLEVIPSTES
jgi:stage II sporulation protein D